MANNLAPTFMESVEYDDDSEEYDDSEEPYDNSGSSLTFWDILPTAMELEEFEFSDAWRKMVMPKRDVQMVDMAAAARLFYYNPNEIMPPVYIEQEFQALERSPNRFFPVISLDKNGEPLPRSFAKRPREKATRGRKCTLKANHFMVDLCNKLIPNLPKNSVFSCVGYDYGVYVHLYNVSIRREKMIPPLDDMLTHLSLDASQDECKSFLEHRTNSVDGQKYCQRCCDNHPDVVPSTLVTSSVNRDVMAELVKLYKESHLGNKLPAYDGNKSLYTAGHLPFDKQEFNITLRSKHGPTRRRSGSCCSREVCFKVSIKYDSLVNAGRVDPKCGAMSIPWKPEDSPPEALKALHTVLGQFPSSQYTRVGRSFYCLGTPILGNALCAWSGFSQSLRPTQMGLSLSIDTSSTVFIEPLPVTEFITQLLQINDISARQPSDTELVKIKKALKGVQVESLKLGQAETLGRKFWIQNVRWPFFQVAYTRKLSYRMGVLDTHLPKYLHMKECIIVKGQRYSKRLNELQATTAHKFTHQSPQERAGNILKTVRLNNDNNRDYAKEFGITINTNLTSVEARILPSPRLKYHDHGLESDCVPQAGVWDMKNKKLVNGGRVECWTCINFAESVSDELAQDFCHALGMKCKDMGMDFNLVPVIPVRSFQRNQLKEALENYREKIELLFFILPDDNGSLYGDLKRICETDIGIVSQCCLRKHVVRRKDSYLTNVALKVNVKVGGRNTVLADALSMRIPIVRDVPTIIFGADVSHPQPGEGSSHSIAAVVASQDWPEITKYAASVCSQAHQQEFIKDLYRGEVRDGMIRELLLSFYIETGYKPHRIIFYRDGVSEGQFHQVLSYELDAIRQACASLDDYYQPAVTFVMVQKRNHTRLFPDYKSMDGIGNVLPGTVVDSKICHPTQFDFYLCSHAGIQGTSRPVRYHVLWDDNKFSADALQSLTNNLCYTYARCTRSVSIVPPAYYAHLAASRARFYMEPDYSGSKISATAAAAGHRDMVTALAGGESKRARGASKISVADMVTALAGGKSTRVQGAKAAAVRPLSPLHANVKRVMFYC